MPSPAARYAKHPKLTPTPRPDPNPSTRSKIDVTLKAARQCAHQTTSLIQCLQDEMRILERAYYKNANQHRTALFWRRVQEVRRLGKRVLEVQLLEVVNNLRYSFYVREGKEQERNPKILRGAWSQVPDVKYLNSVYERLVGVMDLLSTAKERLLKAFHSLSLMMQTGAFLQTILLLTAIVSRINAVIEELLSTFPPFMNHLKALLEVLGHKLIKSRTTESESQTTRRREMSRKRSRPRSLEREDETIDPGEDLGSTVLRRKSVPETDEPASYILGVDRGHDESTPMDEEEPPPPSFSPKPEVPNVIVTIAAAPTTPGKTENLSAASMKLVVSSASRTNSKADIASSETRKVKKKKKKRKDEIDEIFGSLS